ncbi:sensor histidine kinase [Kitasatospora sp. NPDC059571]|uniref:sensor histidine kinase n=1 Tax=Kitasatospora sp. NPDC059571 TaxID=3346871 RepID=UPI00367481CB
MTYFDRLAHWRPPPAAVDATVTVLVALGSLTAVANGAGGADAVAVVLALLTALPIAVHRRWPVPALLTVAVAAGVLQARHDVPEVVGPHGISLGGTFVAVAVAVFLTAVRSESRAVLRLLAVTALAAVAVEAVLVPDNRVAAAFAVTVLLVGAGAVGGLVRARRTMAAERLAVAEREHAAEARAAVTRERARIARELHDIVAHNVSLMVVQTIAADRVQDRDPAKAHGLHSAIEETGRATVTELRRLLDVLRTDDEDEPARRPPQPRIEEIPRLLQAVREAGLDVRATTAGRPRPLPAGTELAVYRVVQEALTNVLKHAGHTAAGVGLDWGADRLTVTVRDDGPRPGNGPLPTAATAPGPGHGLVGMRERVAAVGGRLEAGPRPGGGFLVRATVPLPEAGDSAAPTPTTDEGAPRHDHDPSPAGR